MLMVHAARTIVLPLVMTAAVCAYAEEPTSTADTKKENVKYAIVIHGGAGSTPAKLDETNKARYEKSLAAALQHGRDMLTKGATALDVVERVVCILEDDGLFNAGKGSVFNSAGQHELDASIMDGRDLSCGGVAGVTTVKNPVSLARMVMTETRHVLLAADGAERFADEMSVNRVQPEYFDTKRQYDRWQSVRGAADAAAAEAADEESKMGTVGCVALDVHGNLAAATSTGGITNKRFGRVGDSPIIGAGTYANNETCAVSCTGTGEHFIRNAVAFDVSARMAYKGETVAEAVRQIVHEKLKAGYGGIIAVSRTGEIALDFNTPGMFRGAADSSGRFEVGTGR